MGDERREVATTLLEVRRETPDAVTLRLDLHGVPFSYRPGQYVEIDPRQFPELAGTLAALEAAKGTPEGPRGFSLCSDASDPNLLEISVKEDKCGPYPPLLSPWIVRFARPGLVIRVLGPLGRYCLPDDSPATVTGFLHLCAGSGVAPNRGMIRFAIGRGWPQRHLLILQNRTEADVFFRKEWPDLAERYPALFKVRHVFSVARGEHVSVDLVRREMEGFMRGATAQALVCGPNRPRDVVELGGGKRRQPGFCELWCGNVRRKAEGLLAQLGFAPDRILTEMW